MGCTTEAAFSVSASGECVVRTERTYHRGRLATETLIVERAFANRTAYGSAG